MDNLEAQIVEHIREHGPSKGSEIARVLNPSHQGRSRVRLRVRFGAGSTSWSGGWRIGASW